MCLEYIEVKGNRHVISLAQRREEQSGEPLTYSPFSTSTTLRVNVVCVRPMAHQDSLEAKTVMTDRRPVHDEASKLSVNLSALLLLGDKCCGRNLTFDAQNDPLSTGLELDV